MIGRTRDIEEHHRAVGEVPRRQLLLDAALALLEPIQGGIQVIRVRVCDPQLLRQRRRVPHPRRGQLRTRVQQPLRDHRQHQGPLAAGSRSQQRVHAHGAHYAEHRLYMAVRDGALDGEDLLVRDQRHAAQRQAQSRDGLGRTLREIGEGGLHDLPAVAPRLAQEHGGGRLPVGHDVYIHGLMLHQYSLNTTHNNSYNMGTYYPINQEPICTNASVHGVNRRRKQSDRA